MRRTAGSVRVATLAVLVALAASACGGTANEAGPQPSPTMAHAATPTTTPEPSPSQSPERTPEAQPSPTPEPSAATDPEPAREPPPDPEPSPEPSFPVKLAGQDIEVIPTDQPIVALTFDAGANAAAVPSILSTLEQEGITSTFFLTGNFVQSFPDEARAIVAAGHRLGNHSVSHPAFTELTDAELRAEVLDAQRTILNITGADPRPFFRFPLGDRNQDTIAAVNDLGYVAVRWTVDTLGWQGTSGGRSAAEVTERVLDTARPGQIVLMHIGSHPTDGSTLDADALPNIIHGLWDRGYAFVTLDVLL